MTQEKLVYSGKSNKVIIGLLVLVQPRFIYQLVFVASNNVISGKCALTCLVTEPGCYGQGKVREFCIRSGNF